MSQVTTTFTTVTCLALAAQVACGGDRTLAVCQHEVRDAEARGAADRRLLGSWCVAITVSCLCAVAQPSNIIIGMRQVTHVDNAVPTATHRHVTVLRCRSKRWEALTVDVSQGSSHESLGGQPSSGLAPLGSAMSLSASAASLGKDPSKAPSGGTHVFASAVHLKVRRLACCLCAQGVDGYPVESKKPAVLADGISAAYRIQVQQQGECAAAAAAARCNKAEHLEAAQLVAFRAHATGQPRHGGGAGAPQRRRAAEAPAPHLHGRRPRWLCCQRAETGAQQQQQQQQQQRPCSVRFMIENQLQKALLLHTHHSELM
jgi:hypothetical protein